VTSTPTTTEASPPQMIADMRGTRSTAADGGQSLNAPEATLRSRQRRLRRTLECLTGVAFTEGNELTVLRNGDRIFPAMLHAIDGARRTVDLMTYVYWKGDIAHRFAEALSAAAGRGVRVRLLIDAVGGLQIEKGLVDRMDEAGVHVEWFRKPWLKSPFKHNHRCHRKVLVVDEQLGFIGGVGIAEEWCGDARNEREWRDTHARVRGRRSTGCPRLSRRTGPRAGASCTTTGTSSPTSRSRATPWCRSFVARPAWVGTTCKPPSG
jgi:phosphatidylserine/phosphatidylglycerophosphate/cardiolipin synthase-like enzyme